MNLRLGEGASRAFDRLRAGSPGDDDLRDHGVERPGDGVALPDAGVDAHARSARVRQPRDAPGGGHEPGGGVLAVEAELDRVAARDGREVGDRLSGGDAELLAHEVEAGDLLAHGVLDLEARVHLEERDRAVRADEELARARALVFRLAEDGLGRPNELGVLLVGQERRGRLLDEFLVPTLERAVAGRDDDDVAVGVGEALGLDVAGLVEEALDEASPRPNAAASRTADAYSSEMSSRGPGDLEAAPAAAEGRLDGDGKPVLLREGEDLVGDATGSGVPGTSGAPAFCAMCRAETLSPSASIAAGGGPIQTRPGVEDGLGESRVLGEEAVAGVDACAPERAAMSRSFGTLR